MDSNVNGLMFQLGNIMRIDNGFVEESVCFNTAGGYIVVSYNDTSMGKNNRQQVRLNINRNGTLYVMDVDGSGDSYKVKSISKISDNSYKAEIENDAYDEVITDTINFKITNNSNGKCVIDECDKK